VEATDVLSILDALQAAQLRVWLDGGWGVDALLGEKTRTHEDVDLVVELETLPNVLRTLRRIGFSVAEDHAPIRVVLRASDGRQIDLHLVTFDEEGTGWQLRASPDGSDCSYPSAGLGQGHILGRTVPCLTLELQLEHHRGYEPRDRDVADMARLADRFRPTSEEPN
jgi:lincosamide nucleotidyltransferase A/C/D/E